MERMKLVLASKHGGQAEIITDGETGLLFDHDVDGEFTAKLFAALAMENEAISNITANAYHALTRYDAEQIIDKKLDLLSNAAKKLSSTRPVFPFQYQEAFERKKKDANKLLSVVIPCYNMGRYLDECINAVMSSDYPEKEIIVVDDGSTDTATLNRIQYWAAKGVKVISQSNSGVAKARNRGAAEATGRYLAFLDADDKVSAFYFSKSVHLLASYSNVFFVGCWAKYFGNATATWPTFTPQPPYLLVHNMVNSSALVYERMAFLAAGQNDKAVDYGLEDYESVVSMMSKGFNGVVLPEPHFYYRVRRGSMIRAIRKEKWLYSYKYIATKHESYFKAFAAPVSHLLNANGPGYSYDNPTLDKSPGHMRAISPAVRRLANRYPFIKRTLINLIHLTNKKA
jgi:glycosyltransferase involved in cell wall biosynthesis